MAILRSAPCGNFDVGGAVDNHPTVGECVEANTTRNERHNFVDSSSSTQSSMPKYRPHDHRAFNGGVSVPVLAVCI